MTTEYYLNNQRSQNCVDIPSRESRYLDKTNFLSEFITPVDKEIARQNLGIPEVLEKINQKIDSKVIERGAIPWDITPTENSNAAISSGNIYNTLLNYALNTEVDSKIQEVYRNSLRKINEYYNNIEQEINQLNLNLRQQLDNSQQNFCLVPLEGRVSSLEHDLQSMVKSGQYGTVVSNDLGKDEFKAVSQKTLTDALNKIWNKLDSITGEVTQGINMRITPPYFIGNKVVNVDVEAIGTNAKFEHIAFYANDTIIDEASDVRTFNTSFKVRETTEVKCVATIMGIEYEETKTITKYNGFFILAGDFESTTETLETIDQNVDQYITTINNNNLEGYYTVQCQQGDRIIIMLDASLARDFIRADFNGVVIEFNQELVNFRDENYVMFTSVNTFTAGTYNIYING